MENMPQSPQPTEEESPKNDNIELMKKADEAVRQQFLEKKQIDKGRKLIRAFTAEQNAAALHEQALPRRAVEESPSQAETEAPAQAEQTIDWKSISDDQLDAFFSGDTVYDGVNETEDIVEEEAPAEAAEGTAQAAAEEAMRKYIYGEFVSKSMELHHLEKRRDALKLKIKNGKNIAARARKETGSNESDLNYPDRAKDEAELREVEAKIAAIPNKSPEAYIAYHAPEVKKHLDERGKRELITTPFVQKKLEEVQKHMRAGEAVFIHGDLGMGKTELAKTAAKRLQMERAAEMLAKIECGKGASAEKILRMQKKCYERLGRILAGEDQLEVVGDDVEKADCYRRLAERCVPILVAGNEDTQVTDLLVDRTLTVDRSNLQTPEALNAAIEQYVENWKSMNPEKADDEEAIRQQRELAKDLYIAQASGAATKVETVFNGVAKAMMEGRPVIIDEANAIRPEIMIALNQALLAKPGDKVFIPGLDHRLEVKDGFAVLLTGNIKYTGTKDLNAATKSRYALVAYDYLPMADEDCDLESAIEGGEMEKNGLFQVMLLSLMDKSGDISLPDDGGKSLKKLWRLAQLSNDIQKIFSGKKEVSRMNSAGTSETIEAIKLKENVLSIRALERVLEMWQHGQAMDLDTALWMSFINDLDDDKEQTQIINLAFQHGFFKSEDGWLGDGLVRQPGAVGHMSYEEARSADAKPYEYPKQTIIDLRKAVELLYGAGPERTYYPEISLDDLPEDIEAKKQEFRDRVGDYGSYMMEVQRMRGELVTTVDALKVLFDQCGCAVTLQAEA